MGTDGSIPSGGSWSATQRQCVGMPNSVNLEFVWADVGAINNPQPIIIGARFVYLTATWQFTADSANTVQPFPLLATVTWMKFPTAFANFVPPGPPIFPRFPSDVLYPLYIPNATQRSSVCSALLVWLAVFALCLRP